MLIQQINADNSNLQIGIYDFGEFGYAYCVSNGNWISEIGIGILELEDAIRIAKQEASLLPF